MTVPGSIEDRRRIASEELAAEREAEELEQREYRRKAFDVMNQSSPEDAAEALKLGEQFGVPRQAIELDPKVWKQRNEEARRQLLAASSPRTMAWMDNSDNHAVTKDEIDLWGSVESYFGDLTNRPIATLGKTKYAVMRAAGAGFLSAESSMSDLDREQLEKAARYYDDLDAWKAREAERVAAGKGGFINRLGFNTVDVGTLRMQLPGDTDPMPQPTMRLLDEAASRNANIFQRTLGIPGADYKRSQSDAVMAIKPLIQDKMREAVRVSEAKSKAVEEMMPQTGDFVADSLLGGVRAISEMTPLIVSAIASRGKTIPTVVMTGQVYYNEYATGREKGLEIDQATERAVLQAGVESISERISLGIIDNVIKDGGPLALRFTKGLILEQGQEQVATMGGRLVDWAYLEKDKTIQEFIDETPRAMLQTALTTLVASSGMQATFLAADYATQKFLGDSVMTDPSKGDQFIANVMEKFAKANLGKRSPEKAADLVNKIVEGTGAETVVIDLDGLAQSLTTAGMDVREALTQLGVDPDAIGELGQLMGTAEIPMGRLATPSAQLLSAQIIPHMRLATEDLTPFQKTELEGIAELAKRYATDVKEDVARDASKLGAFVDVQEQIYTAAKGSGLNLTEEQYRHNANIAATNVAYIAMKRGQDVRETWAEIGPKIMGRDGAQPQTQAQPEAQGSAALESAKVAGYQGEDRGEAESWVRAVEKGLDMSTEGRIGRAKEQGYDTETVFYRGQRQPVEGDGFIGTLTPGFEEQGLGVSLTSDPDAAEGYGSNIYPVYVGGKFASESEFVARVNALFESEGAGSRTAAARVRAEMQAEGYVGLKADGGGMLDAGEIRVWMDQDGNDPSNIRSVNAAFDPDQADSADLLAQSIRASVRMPMAEVDAWVRDNVDSNFQDFQNGDESAVMTWNLTEDPDSPQVMMGIRLSLKGRADVNLFLDSKMADAMDNVQDVSERRRLANDMFSQAILVMRKYEAETPDLKAFNFIAAESQAEGTNPKSREQLYRAMLSTLKMDGYTAYEVTGQMSVVNTDADGAKVANPLFTPGSKFVLIKDGVDVNEFAKTEILRGTQRGGDAGEVVTALKAVPLTRSARGGVDGGGRDAGRPDPGRDGQQGAEGLTQPRRGGYDPKTREMSFTGISDASTFLHENSHWFLATLEELAPTEKWAADDLAEINSWYQSVRETPKMQQIRARYSVVPDPAGGVRIMYQPPADMAGETPAAMRLERVASMEEAQAKIEWRERQEAWAETTEEYFMTGESPTPRLLQILRDFKNWLVQVYRGMLPGERANLTPEIKSMMDRILAVDVEVEAASAEVFRDARKMADEMLGKGIITPRQHKLVGDRLDKAREQVKEEMLARVMQEKLEAGQASRATERTIILGNLARAWDKSSPVGRAFNWLAFGEWKGDLPNEPGTMSPEEADARSNEEVFQFAGVNAATANLSELERAKRMAQQGASRDEIWEATGWNQRVDGNWRFEVSDDKAALTGMRSGRLEDVLQHPELYDAYPGLRNVIVEDTSSVDAASLGVAADGTLIVRVNWPRVERQDGSGLLSILHELQHGIQTIETWSGGSSPDAVTTDALKAVNKARRDLDSGAIWWTPVDVYRRVAGEVEARTTETRAGMTAEERRRTPPEDDIPRGEQIKDPNLLLAVSEQKNRVMALLTGKPAAVRFSADQLFDRDGGTLGQEGLPLFDNPLKIEGKVTVKAIGIALTDAHMESYGRKLFPEDSAEDYETVLNVARAELAAQMKQPNSGHGWYSKDVDLAIHQTNRIVPGLDTEEGRAVFLTFAGIFSSGLDPQQAWQISIEAYEAFQATGEIPITRADAARAVGKTPPMSTYKDNTTGEKVTKETGWSPRSPGNEQQLQMLKILIEQKGSAVAALDWLINPQPREDINRVVADSGQKTPRFKTKVERDGPPVYGAMIFGEKLGRYTLGLHGVEVGSEDTTVDLWYTRSYRRWTGRLLDKPVGNEGVASQPDPARGGIERLTIFRLTEDLMKDYPGEVTAGDTQAMLWFFEKRLWAAQGLRTDEGTNSAGARQALERRGLEFDERGRGGAAGAEGGAAIDGREGSQQAGDGRGPDQGRGLAPLDGAPRNLQGPIPELVAVAEQYASDNGIPFGRQAEYAEVDPERGARIAQAYEEMQHAPNDPAVREAYQDLIRQTRAQYEALVEAGYVFTFFDGASDPYAGNPSAAMRDLRNNKRMAVYGTYDGYGTEGITAGALADNPMLADTGLQWADQTGVLRPVVANDLFRAVHDAMGHGLEGAGFRARGEENAWQAHVRLFTGPAVGAITSETRGQNSWLNYGPYGETNRTATLENTIFAEQKTGLMPEWTWIEGRVADMATDANESLSQTKAPTFYSALSRFIENSKVASATGAEWKQLLVQPAHTVRSAQRDPATNRVVLGNDGKPVMLERTVPEVFPPNVKPEEVEMSGVMEWLDLQTGPVTREAVAAFVAANGVTVEEVKYSSSLTDNPRLDAIQREMLPLLEENDRLMGEINDLGYSPEADALREAFNRNVELINDLRAERFQIVNSDVDSTKWSSWTLPGGENYTELLLTVPGVDYKDSHFPGVKGTIAHVRYKERIGPNGERVLALEEVQSGIHQAGRKQGYKGSEPLNFEGWYAGNGIELFGMPFEIMPAKSQEMARLRYDRYRAEFGNTAVPNAPFKNNAWVELVLKRMVRYAAENGFDTVAWIPGNIQNGREVEADDNRADFYDKILPNIANKFGKKYGARVTDIETVHSDQKASQTHLADTRRDGTAFVIRTSDQAIVQDGFANISEAVAHARRLNEEVRTTFHSLPITPQLREAALNEGFPLFQPRKFNPPGHGAIAPPTDIPPVRLDLKLVKDLYGEEAVRKLPAAVRRRSSTSSNVTDIIQQIEAVRKVLSVKRKGPQTLTQFIMQRSVKQQDGSKRNRQWGIKGAAGELRAMGLERLINEKSGMPIDAMRELAEEAGFIRAETGGPRATEYGDLDATPNDLLDALAREAKGENVVRIGEEVDNKELDDAKAWASWLEQNGVDIYETDQRKLRASVDQMLRDSDESLVSPDKAAEMFGFANGEELLKALAEVGNRDAFLNKMADQKMVEEFGDMMTDGTLQAEAAEAARLDIAHRQNEIEMEALARALGQQASANYAKSLAKDIIAMRTVKEIAAYERDLNNERQFGKQALRLVEKGDYPGALKAKQRQLVSMQLYTEGKKAHERIEKQRQDLLKYYTSEGRRDKIAGDYLEKIEDILERFELRVSKQGPSVQRERMSAAKYVAEMDAAGRQDEVAPEARLLAELNEKMTWRNMTSTEVEHLVGTVQNLAHLGRTKDSLLKAQEKRKFRALIAEAVDTLVRNGSPGGKLTPKPTREYSIRKTTGEKTSSFLRNMHHWQMRIENQVRQLDGQENGPIWNMLFRPFTEAANIVSRLNRESAAEVSKIWDTYSPIERIRMANVSISLPELGRVWGNRWTKMEVISMALNWGNEYNREALLKGYGWEAAQVEAVFERVMTDKDWDMVEALWKEMGRWKDLDFAVHKQVTGVEPKAVEGISFTLPSGRKIEGKYYHIQYDATRKNAASRRQAQQDQKDLLDGSRRALSSPATKNGALVARTGSGDKQIKLHISVFEKGLAETIHRIGYRTALIDVSKIVSDTAFADAYIDAAGEEAYGQLMPWLEAIAQPTAEQLQGIPAFLAFLRRRLPIVYMGAKVGTAMIQITGIVPSMYAVGPARVTAAMARAYALGPMSVYASWKEVANKSEFMRDRPQGFDRDVREASARKTTMGVPNSFWFILISAIDLAVSVPTWNAAYGKALEGKVKGIDRDNEQDAIAYADAIVRRTQTAGLTQDLPRLMRDKGPGGELQKQVTMLYGYFSGLYAWTSEQVISARRGDISPLTFMMFAVSMFVVVPAMTELIRGNLFGDDDDEDEESTEKKLGDAVISNFAGMFPVIRDMVKYQQDPQFGYNLSPTASLLFDLNKTIFALDQTVKGESEFSEAETKRAIRTLSAFLGLPGAQMVITGDYLKDLLAGEENPMEDPLDAASEAFVKDTR